MLRWTRKGELPAIRLPGGAIRYREDELEGWLTLRSSAPLRYTSGNTSSYTGRYTVSSTAEKTRETRLRRMAERQGLRLVKSRLRDPNAIGYGKYVLINLETNTVAVPDGDGPTGQPAWDLDEIEAWLTGKDR